MDMHKNLIGSRIRLLRDKKGMKQATLAELCGVEINTISRYETGEMTPRIDQLLNLAAVLGVSPMEIVTHHGADSMQRDVAGQPSEPVGMSAHRKPSEHTLRLDMLKRLLGPRIKSLRDRKDWTQEELAEATGVNKNTISRYETGKFLPSIELLLLLAEALDVSPMEILPPQDLITQQLFVLRQDLAEKATEMDSPESLKELIRQANKLHTTKG